MTLLATAVLVVSVRCARRFRRPGRFRAGVVATALGLGCLCTPPGAVLLLADHREQAMPRREPRS